MAASSNHGMTPNQQHPHHNHRHNQHPQLRLPLSHHGLPRAPTSPSSSFSARSNRYEAFSNPHSTASSTATTPAVLPHAAGPKHQHNPSIASSSSASTKNASTAAKTGMETSQRAASFFRYSRTGDAPPSPPMTPFSPSAFPSEASTPMVLSPALSPPPPSQTAASDDSASPCCAHCRHCGRSASETADSQQQRSRSVEDVPSPVRRQASTRSLDYGGPSSSNVVESSVLPSMDTSRGAASRQERSRSRSREGRKGADRGSARARSRAKGPDGHHGSEKGTAASVSDRADGQDHEKDLAAAALFPPLHVPPAPSSSSSSFSRMGKRIKAVLGGPKKNDTSAATAAAASTGVRSVGTDAAAERKAARRRERGKERDVLEEVEEVGSVHWTEM